MPTWKTYCSAIRSQPHYRHDAFAEGLRAIGLRETHADLCDVFVVWNRYGALDRQAKACEKRGGVVLVAENGYLGNDFAGARWYAISKSQHNGAGSWPQGDSDRWDKLGVELKPWRSGSELVALPQRGIGPAGVAMPLDWINTVRHKLSKSRLRVRNHPGAGACTPLEDDLANADAVVTWGSGAALKALVMGIPVFYDFPRWIGGSAARPVDEFKLGPLRDDAARLAMFRRLAWAQWRLSEIQSGEAFRWLLES